MTDLKARLAQPDGTMETLRGVDMTRTHAKRCPHCLEVFYGYERVDQPMEPFTVDPEPRIGRNGGRGLRGTCGDPRCREAEERHQAARKPGGVILQKGGRP